MSHLFVPAYTPSKLPGYRETPGVWSCGPCRLRCTTCLCSCPALSAPIVSDRDSQSRLWACQLKLLKNNSLSGERSSGLRKSEYRHHCNHCFQYRKPKFCLGQSVMTRADSMHIGQFILYPGTNYYYKRINARREAKWSVMSEQERNEYLTTTTDRGNNR